MTDPAKPGITSRFRAVLPILVGVLLCVGVPASAEAAEGVPCGAEPTDMSIVYGDVITCAIDVIGDTDVFRFFGSAGENPVIQVARSSGIFQPCLDVVAPDNTHHVACGFSNFNRLDFQLTQSGTYTILVADFGQDGGGPYALVLERVVPASPSAEPILYGQTLTPLETSPIGDLDVFTFNGLAGSTVRMLAARLTGIFQPCVHMIAPDNTRIVACAFSNANQIDAALTQSGVYTMLIEDFGHDGGGTYALSLQCLVGPCNTTGPPSFSVTLTGCTACQGGNPFIVQGNLSNPGPATQVEIKVGLRLPDGTGVNLLGPGGQHLVIPMTAGMNSSFTLVNLPWPAGLPAGTWSFEGTLMEIALGKTFSRDVKTYQVVP